MTHDSHPGRPYRARHGMILGVCAGLARYFDMSTFWMRVLWFLIFLATGFWPIVFIYFFAGLLMKPAPVVPVRTDAEAEFYNSATNDRRMAIHRLKRVYESLNRRIQRMESLVTSREYNWNKRMREV